LKNGKFKKVGKSNTKRGDDMVENKYFCQNCGAEIASTVTVCPNCGKNLKDVGRRIEVTVTETIGLSDEVKVGLTKEQISTIEKVLKAVKKELAKMEIESVTLGFPPVSITIKRKAKQSKEK
jgi:predicted ATP-dependent serine protease